MNHTSHNNSNIHVDSNDADDDSDEDSEDNVNNNNNNNDYYEDNGLLLHDDDDNDGLSGMSPRMIGNPNTMNNITSAAMAAAAAMASSTSFSSSNNVDPLAAFYASTASQYHHQPSASSSSSSSSSNSTSIQNQPASDVDFTGAMLSQQNQVGFDAIFHGRFGKRYQRNNKRGKLKNLRCFPECGMTHKEKGFCGRPLFITLSCPKNEPLRLPICWAEFVPCEMKPQIVPGSKVPLKYLLENERTKEFPLNPFLRGKVIIESERINEIQNNKTNQQQFKDFVVGFNLELRGWHYSWVSNKHSCDSLHTLQIYVFHPSNVTSHDGVELGKRFVSHLADSDIHVKQVVVDTIDEILAPALISVSEDASLIDSQQLQARLFNIELECDAIFRSPIFRIFCRRRRRFVVEPTAPIAPIKQKLQSAMSSNSLLSMKSEDSQSNSFTIASNNLSSMANSNSNSNSGNSNSHEKSRRSSRISQSRSSRASSGRKSKIQMSPLKIASINDATASMQAHIDSKANLFQSPSITSSDDPSLNQNSLWYLSAALESVEGSFHFGTSSSPSMTASNAMELAHDETRRKMSRDRSELLSSSIPSNFTPLGSPKSKKMFDHYQHQSASSSTSNNSSNSSSNIHNINNIYEDESAFLLLQLSEAGNSFPSKHPS